MEVEKWDLKDWRNWVAIVTWVLLPLFIFIGLVPGWSSTWDWLGKNSSNIASWVQAVGSIAAIGAAAYGIKWQVQESQKQMKFTDDERIRQENRTKYMFLFFKISDIYSWADTAIQHRSLWRILWDALRSDIERHLTALEKIHINEHPSPISVYEMNNIYRALLRAHEFSQRDVSKDDDYAYESKLLEGAIKTLKEMANVQVKNYMGMANSMSTDQEKVEFSKLVSDTLSKYDGIHIA